MNKTQIVRAFAREILDSRGTPTIESTVMLSDGSLGVASVPSGKSKGKYEAHELRDGDENRYFGMGVQNAIHNVNRLISPAICGLCAMDISEVDRQMIMLDGRKDKSKLGANAMLSVSLAAARAAASSLSMPLYRFIGGESANVLPVPMMNILNGGAHAKNSVDIQEFMIVPIGAENFASAIRMCAEVYKKLYGALDRAGHITSIGDEGGFAPNLKDDREALDFLLRAIENSGYEDKIKIAVDCAASEWKTDNGYRLTKSGKEYSSDELASYIRSLTEEYPIISVEDPFGEDDLDGFSNLYSKIGDRVMIVGDDLFVTDVKRIRAFSDKKSANSVLIKPNQIGTLTETLDAIREAKMHSMKCIMSHRSGETEDTSISDISVGTLCPFIKAGAPARAERTAKYNRLLKIENSLTQNAVFGKEREKPFF